MRYRKVKNNPHWIRDVDSGLLINTNVEEFNKLKNEQRVNSTVRTLKNDINNIKDEMSELKSILKELTYGGNRTT